MIKVSGIDVLNEKNLENIVAMDQSRQQRFRKLKSYFDKGKSDGESSVVANFCSYITQVSTGYFIGRPVTYTAAEGGSDFLEHVQDVLTYNDEQDHNAQLAESISIFGCAFEVLYMDEDAKIRFACLPVEEVIPIYLDSIEERLIAALRVYTVPNITTTTEKTYRAELYTDAEVISYTVQAGKFTESERAGHPFKDVPINVYRNNNGEYGDFEKVVDLIDGYNRSQGNTAADMDDFTDAFLMLVGMSGTRPEDVAEAKKNKVLLLENEGAAAWLTKQVNDTWVENYKNRLQNDIHIISMVPRLTDESFAGNVSGEAMKYKLWGLEQITSKKERKFKRALQRRLELIANVLEIKRKEFDYRLVQIKFQRSLPVNTTETAETISKYSGILSHETLIGMVPGIEDPAAEYQKYLNEREANSAYAGWAPAPAEHEPEGDE